MDKHSVPRIAFEYLLVLLTGFKEWVAAFVLIVIVLCVYAFESGKWLYVVGVMAGVAVLVILYALVVVYANKYTTSSGCKGHPIEGKPPKDNE